MGGEGGTDAKIFASELFAAYTAYLANHNLAWEEGETGPSKWSLTCASPSAARLFANESGIHCIQRVPHNERGGRRHTSCVAVVVTPLRDKPSQEMREEDLQEIFQRGHGKGGQGVNKVNSAVRLRHIPTGLEVFINGRDQIRNRATARAALAGKLADHIANQQTRQSYGGAGRGNKIRTYNTMEGRVTDHRTGVKTNQIRKVLIDGHFELFG